MYIDSTIYINLNICLTFLFGITGNVQSSIMAKTSLLSKDFGNNSVDVYGVGEIILEEHCLIQCLNQ